MKTRRRRAAVLRAAAAYFIGMESGGFSRRRGQSMLYNLYKGGRRFLAVSEDFMPNPQFAVLSLTEAAAARARNLIASAGRPVAGLRSGIKVGGCAGMTYTMGFRRGSPARR